MTTLTADALAERHTYLAGARPDWRATIGEIRARGGPWYCHACDAPSYLCYRCSICGRDLAGDTKTQGRQS